MFKKGLIYKFTGSEVSEYSKPDFIEIKMLTKKDILGDKFLSTKKDNLVKLIKEGHKCFGLWDKNNNKFFAYACLASQRDSTPPSHIKEIPKNSFWDHFTRVSQEYQGHGYQRLLLQERIKYLEKLYGKGFTFYSDTSANNIASRKNIIRSGLEECGVYTTLRIGTERTKPFYLHLFFWNKNKKHPLIK